MKQEAYLFDKEALRTLTEKYLAKEIFEKEILHFLTTHPLLIKKFKKGEISRVISERAGKAQNTIYKIKNEFTNYSAVSFFRYWQAMLSICREHDVPKEDFPKLDILFAKYSTTLDFINHIAIEENLSILLKEHSTVINNLHNTLKNTKLRALTTKEKQVLMAISEQSTIQNELNNKLDAQRERMHKK